MIRDDSDWAVMVVDDDLNRDGEVKDLEGLRELRGSGVVGTADSNQQQSASACLGHKFPIASSGLAGRDLRPLINPGKTGDSHHDKRPQHVEMFEGKLRGKYTCRHDKSKEWMGIHKGGWFMVGRIDHSIIAGCSFSPLAALPRFQRQSLCSKNKMDQDQHAAVRNPLHHGNLGLCG